jgi:hypothetical protein
VKVRSVLISVMVLMVVTMGFFVGRSDVPAADQEQNNALVEDVESEGGVLVEHVSLPDEVRGLYWTGTTAGGSRGDQLLEYMKEMGINAVVVDTKMDNGQLVFTPNDASLSAYAMPRPAVTDLEALLTKLRDAGLYRIARIPVMRDDTFALAHSQWAMHGVGGGLWQDKIGSLWMDPAAPEVAEYAIALAREVYARGFDEVQFDYVRFASDGSINSIVYPVYDKAAQTKSEVMRMFFDRVGAAMRESGIPVSYDVFGMTFETTSDFNIGQRLIDVYPNADFISPMVYPSHYAPGYNGCINPALCPYEVVYRSLERGVSMVEATYGLPDREVRPKMRPWLQDFDIGAVYTADLIEAQIKATRDAGASGWILWNARNVYEPANYLP